MMSTGMGFMLASCVWNVCALQNRLEYAKQYEKLKLCEEAKAVIHAVSSSSSEIEHSSNSRFLPTGRRRLPSAVGNVSLYVRCEAGERINRPLSPRPETGESRLLTGDPGAACLSCIARSGDGNSVWFPSIAAVCSNAPALIILAPSNQPTPTGIARNVCRGCGDSMWTHGCVSSRVNVRSCSQFEVWDPARAPPG
eukprot:m.65132 g.65132  ORF g.65132 m.65132 type:complete len:196 (-) comp9742_c0_seq1:193-780(-)